MHGGRLSEAKNRYTIMTVNYYIIINKINKSVID